MADPITLETLQHRWTVRREQLSRLYEAESVLELAQKAAAEHGLRTDCLSESARQLRGSIKNLQFESDQLVIEARKLDSTFQKFTVGGEI